MIYNLCKKLIAQYKAKGQTRFVAADDSYYDAYRALIGEK